MCWTFQDDIAVIDVVIMMGRHVVVPEVLKTQALHQLHVNHMTMEKTKVVACELVYWFNRNDCTTCLIFQQTQLKDKTIHHDITGKLLDVIGTDMFTLNNKHYLCIVDYNSKFPFNKKTEDLSTDSIILMCKSYFCRIWSIK